MNCGLKVDNRDSCLAPCLKAGNQRAPGSMILGRVTRFSSSEQPKSPVASQITRMDTEWIVRKKRVGVFLKEG